MSRDSENLDAPIRRESSPLITKQDLAGRKHPDSGFLHLMLSFGTSPHLFNEEGHSMKKLSKDFIMPQSSRDTSLL